jgi:hypothetical protein
MGALIPSWAARQDFVLLRLAMRSLLSVEGLQKLFPAGVFRATLHMEEVHTSCRSRCKRDRSSLHCAWELGGRYSITRNDRISLPSLLDVNLNAKPRWNYEVRVRPLNVTEFPAGVTSMFMVCSKAENRC